MRWFNWILLPFSLVYGTILEVRNRLFDFGILSSYEPPIPTISVGNLAVGGTGKTPHIKYLIELLEPDYTLAVLSRGYGRTSKGFYEVQTNSSSKIVGDEPLEIKCAYQNMHVFVCEKRKDGIQRILKQNPDINLILLDDAYQHRYVKPYINLCLSTYQRPYFNDWPMPMGRLREFKRNVKRSTAVIFSKTPEAFTSFPEQNSHFYSHLVYSSFKTVLSKQETSSQVLFVSGLASDEQPWKYVKSMYPNAKKRSYGDHHMYSENDVKQLEKDFPNHQWVTTEKDWIKLKDHQVHIHAHVSILPVQVKFNDHKFDEFIFNKLNKWKT